MGPSARCVRGLITEEVNSEGHRDTLFERKREAFHDLFFNKARYTSIPLVGVFLKDGSVVFAGMSTTVQQHCHERLQLLMRVARVVDV
jgi:hypothetical protein